MLIKFKESKVKKLKKAFGLCYMNHAQEDSSDQQLRDCVNKARAEITTIERAITELKIDVDRIEERTEMKLKKSPKQLKKEEKKAAHSKKKFKSHHHVKNANETAAFHNSFHCRQNGLATTDHVENHRYEPEFADARVTPTTQDETYPRKKSFKEVRRGQKKAAHSNKKLKSHRKGKKAVFQEPFRQNEFTTGHGENYPCEPRYAIAHCVTPTAQIETYPTAQIEPYPYEPEFVVVAQYVAPSAPREEELPKYS